MLDLITNFSIQQILEFIVLLALAIKGGVSFFDWAYGRIKKVFAKETNEKEAHEQIQDRLDNFEEELQEIIEGQKINANCIKQLENDINILTESDKDDIKAFIVKEHHYFCYDKKWIDDYSLDSIEKRYSHYKQEGGNSFIQELMNELRALPKKPPKDIGT